MAKPTIIYEHTDFLVINKPPNMAVCPPYHESTLQDWLIEQKLIDPSVFKPEDNFGIVHRIDADTSGIVIWAKNPETQQKLKDLWQGRSVEKTYLALVVGDTEDRGVIELSIKRDNKKDQQTISWLPASGERPAISHYQKLATAEVGAHKVSLLQVKPITGRTHQIRVHLQAINHSIIGDSVYGNKETRDIAEELGLTRQFLHAYKISLPNYGNFEAELTDDLLEIIKHLGVDKAINI